MQLLPIGTVVKLKNMKKWVMIYGRNQIQQKSQNTYDYIAVPYPEGNITEDFNVFFNRTMIDEILHIGFETPQEQAMREKVEQEIQKAKASVEKQ